MNHQAIHYRCQRHPRQCILQVVRHVGRERVPQKDMETWPSSPNNKENFESGGIIKKTRDSEVFDETR